MGMISKSSGIIPIAICMSFLSIREEGVPRLKPPSLKNTGIIKLDLGGTRDAGIWTASGNNNGSNGIAVPSQVPGGIYSDLDANGVFSSEIYSDYNDLETKWVGRTNWTFTRQFTPSLQLLAKNKIVLVCNGLDTIADVYINDVLVGSGKNMFVRYVFDIKNAIRQGVNTLRVAFTSPVGYAQSEYLRHVEEEGYPVLPDSLVPEFRGENQGQMIRKMPSSFSWDWGPSYPSSGIWQSIYIEGLSGAVIRDVLIFTKANRDPPDETVNTIWNVTARVYFDINEGESGTLTLRRLFSEYSEDNEEGSSRTTKSTSTSIPVKFEKSLGKSIVDDPSVDISLTVPGNAVRLWWPNGHGSPNLYPFEVQYVSDLANETSTKTLRIGFRTVELVQDLMDVNIPEWGRHFYFRVNGRPIYSKGSNSIPFHVLPERVTEEGVRWMLESAKDLHSNMIRVWGGGMYEYDYFYDLADELGIFIWQDFMFACAMYPATPSFLLNVVEEVHTQVRRLQHHPSLIMWAANNENEAALRQNWYGTAGPNFDRYVEDFIKLYVDTIIGNVTSLDESRDCLSSSPTNGVKSEEEGWISQNPGDSRYGDIHHYDYYNDSWSHEIFKRWTRYASEYGYQSFPYLGTLEGVASNLQEWTWMSDFVEHRQRHPKGQVEMRDLIQSHLPFPREYNSSEAFPAMIYMAQIMQSMGQKTQTEVYRRLVDKLNTTDGTGRTMGALYWQLNDIWEGCSWASFEINGRWKMHANYIKRAFHPILPSPYRVPEGDVVIELISDAIENYSGIMRVRVFNLESMVPLLDRRVSVGTRPLTSPEVHRITPAELNAINCGLQSNGTSSPCIVYLTMPDGIPDNFLWLQYPRDKAFLKNPNLRVSLITSSPDQREFSITLLSDEVAPFVFLNLKGQGHTHGKFSDNGFILVESPKTIGYESRDPIVLEEFINELDIVSLFDVTGVAE